MFLGLAIRLNRMGEDCLPRIEDRPSGGFLHLAFAKSFPYRDDKVVCSVNVRGTGALWQPQSGNLLTLPHFRCLTKMQIVFHSIVHTSRELFPNSPPTAPRAPACTALISVTQYLAFLCGGVVKRAMNLSPLLGARWRVCGVFWSPRDLAVW